MITLIPSDYLVPFACRPETGRGRLVAEPESPIRTAYQRDRDRIIHSGAFRKLKYKTQVFVYHEGDYYRTRLTHSLEVAQIARTLCRVLGLNEDLAEAVALAHDLGHAPFGHAGEDALNAAMAPFGGFSHNDQTLRVLTRLEHRYADFDGLNMTWETLEGVVKHNGPLHPALDGAIPALSATLAEVQTQWDLDLNGYPSAEAQVAALADDIAYNNHDLDDGLRAGLFTVDEIADLPLVGPIVAEVRRRYPGLERSRLIHEIIRRLIDRMVTDLLTETRSRLERLAPQSPDAIRCADREMVAFSETMLDQERHLRAFLFRRMYRHYRVNRETSKARRVVRDLFALFHTEPNCLPSDWQDDLQAQGGNEDPVRRARLVVDYIAGMTDRFALLEHRRLFDLDSQI
ncbi:Deoxyguanosinetriphosphate triphosphohydrolase-like protein [uncultured Gammaproteobacteria bacterium]